MKTNIFKMIFLFTAFFLVQIAFKDPTGNSEHLALRIIGSIFMLEIILISFAKLHLLRSH